ncbi:hypothetical protein [uncultured Bacteroides sp.]|uniref:hypothetical protein n=1 Tax=uncultured Bacteroides sp. TaxID=162156 RepID=UPI00260FB89B|nr:hypothetical protein [uncultured Bacteroides sp.]
MTRIENLISRREMCISPAGIYILAAEIYISRREIKFSPYMNRLFFLYESVFLTEGMPLTP